MTWKRTQEFLFQISNSLAGRNVFVFISKCTNFWTQWCAVGIWFWFALNPVNLCWFDVSSFWTTLTLFCACVFVLFTSCRQRRLTSRVWVKCCVRAKYSEENSSIQGFYCVFKKSIITEFISNLIQWEIFEHELLALWEFKLIFDSGGRADRYKHIIEIIL